MTRSKKFVIITDMDFKRRNRKNYSAWIRASIYVVMLLLIGATMRIIISEESREMIRAFFAAKESNSIEAQKMNWCPLAITKIVILASKKEVTDPGELFKLCETESEPYELKDLENVKFQPFLLAFSGEDEKLSLEIGSVSGFFRIGDLPLRSSHLEKELSKYR